MRFDKEKGLLEKRAYNNEELTLMYKNLISQRSTLKPHFFWSTMIAMFSGMRLYEVTQLHLTNIKQVDDIWTMNITDKGENQKLKGESSRRCIPIHDKLIELGLLEYMGSLNSERLFPKLTYLVKKTTYGKVVGDWLNRRFLVGLNLKSKQLDFHSFRRAFITNLLNGSRRAYRIFHCWTWRREHDTAVQYRLQYYQASRDNKQV